VPVLRYRDPGDGLWKPVPVGSAPILSGAYGFRNVIRNGDMQIAQRGDGPFTTNGYTVDGWQNNTSKTQTTNRVVPIPGVSGWALSSLVTGQSVASDYCQLYQRIEDVMLLSGKTVTVSFKAKAASGTPKISANLIQNFGNGGSPEVSVKLPPVTLSTFWASYSITGSIPSVAGAVLGISHYLRLSLWMSAGSDYAGSYSDVGLQNNTFYITDVQLEEGPVATPFERLPVQQQLAWCQRYFQRIKSVETSYASLGLGRAYDPTRINFIIEFLQQMRSNPSVAVTAPNTFRIDRESYGTSTCNSIGFDTTSQTRSAGHMTGVTPVVITGQAIEVTNYPGVVAYFDFSAEL
jgi:hypothetical protein